MLWAWSEALGGGWLGHVSPPTHQFALDRRLPLALLHHLVQIDLWWPTIVSDAAWFQLVAVFRVEWLISAISQLWSLSPQNCVMAGPKSLV
jgi:hypothetical protein